MQVAIVGGGVAGLSVAERLHPRHSITLFEAADRLGGDARTLRFERWGRTWNVDTGFVVFNETTYPEFTAMLARLGVETRASDMSFGVRDVASGLEWAGATLDAVFAQRLNLVRPTFLRMLAEVVRFNREVERDLEAAGPGVTLGTLLARGRYSAAFRDHYLVPMGAAIWSAPEQDMLAFPAAFFVRFFRNHGLLARPDRQLAWRTICGGSIRYVDALSRPFADRVYLRTPVLGVRRWPDRIALRTMHQEFSFDEVVFATHADRALETLVDPSPLERELLSAFHYQENAAVLHTCISRLPRSRRAWASWNYRRPRTSDSPVSVTYDMSRLQGLDSPEPFLVTLNDPEPIDPERIVARLHFEHPVFSTATIRAQARHAEVSGADRIHYCGAYWRNGFHEDGYASGLTVAAAFESARPGVRA